MIFQKIIPKLHPTKDTPDIPFKKRAAVSMIFREDNHFCMIRRAIKENDHWSGHMAFPGGREESRDLNLQQTALRETREEIGLDLRRDQYLGRLSNLEYPELQVSAFVYRLQQEAEFRLEQKEVASVHWLPFDVFLDPSRRERMQHSYKGKDYDLPIVYVGEANVWGISLFFIDDLIKRLKS